MARGDIKPLFWSCVGSASPRTSSQLKCSWSHDKQDVHDFEHMSSKHLPGWCWISLSNVLFCRSTSVAKHRAMPGKVDEQPFQGSTIPDGCQHYKKEEVVPWDIHKSAEDIFPSLNAISYSALSQVLPSTIQHFLQVRRRDMDDRGRLVRCNTWARRIVSCGGTVERCQSLTKLKERSRNTCQVRRHKT